jgi:hypothetical protein
MEPEVRESQGVRRVVGEGILEEELLSKLKPEEKRTQSSFVFP